MDQCCQLSKSVYFSPHLLFAMILSQCRCYQLIIYFQILKHKSDEYSKDSIAFIYGHVSFSLDSEIREETNEWYFFALVNHFLFCFVLFFFKYLKSVNLFSSSPHVSFLSALNLNIFRFITCFVLMCGHVTC